ncbi:unnamed protein product [Adineta steineri]|uniref:DUF7932 domain-containing protein n=4 Tax=Adineta steineri TaxID=433720 RepID=A0A815BN82_9BILA|nr:unnamed protein product [Adineta steineri]
MSIITEVGLQNFSFDVDSVSYRASQKSVDQTISIGGQSGSNGYVGIHGSAGHCGQIGRWIATTPGSKGGDGGKGSDGGNGCLGTDSQNALIWLNGTVDDLIMQVKTFNRLNNSYNNSGDISWHLEQPFNDLSCNFKLAKSNGIILMKANGGNGGNGGLGGNGGPGGRGGDGYRGGNGDAGGNGGCGGRGGNGGCGGDGGNAGAGGHIQVQSADPRLFMLIEMDCRAGKKGQGGTCGSGGRGGKGGRGGSPGGEDAPSGRDGPDGAYGNNGHSNGQDGLAANSGSIQYAVVDIHGNIIETGSDKYHVSVYSYTITDENNDGIYEPNSIFFITNVKWINNGAITLPSGSILSFPSTEYITTDMNDISILQGNTINQVVVDPHQFQCHLHDAYSVSINEPYIKCINITSEVKLLNCLFTGSKVSTTLTCQYPIQITKIEIPTYLGPGEQSSVIINFKNISTRVYGECLNSAGSIELILSTHSLIKILPANDHQYIYEIKSDGFGYYKINEEIFPQSTKRIKFEIKLDENSSQQYFEHLFWEIDLLLRNKLIEKRQNTIRIVPTFQPNIHTDVLLVTNSKVGRIEFLAYQNLFQLFKYSSQTWDIERYGVFHNPEIKWLNTTDLIIFIYLNSESTFNVIQSQLFLQHMKSSEKSGFISIGSSLSNEFDFALFDYNNLQFLNIKDQMKSESTNYLWSAFGSTRPHQSHLLDKANKFRINYEKQDDQQYLYQVVFDNTANTDSTSCMKVVYGAKYIYKSTLDCQVGNRLIMVPTNNNNPLLTSSNLPFTIQTELNTTQQGSRIIKNSIDLKSHFGRLLCAILFYQGFEKSYLIISEQEELSTCIFSTGSHKFNYNQILISLAMSIIEREYDRQILQFPSSKKLIHQIENIIHREDKTNYGMNENDWLYLLIQSLYEYIDSKFWSSFPWCGCTMKAKQRHKLQELLNDLLSLTTVNISKNKSIYQQLSILRLQKLANLKFPAADYRQISARLIHQIQTWQREQQMNRISSPTDEIEKY